MPAQRAVDSERGAPVLEFARLALAIPAVRRTAGVGRMRRNKAGNPHSKRRISSKSALVTKRRCAPSSALAGIRLGFL
jgi:hypothetical protein